MAKSSFNKLSKVLEIPLYQIIFNLHIAFYLTIKNYCHIILLKEFYDSYLVDNIYLSISLANEIS